MTLRGTNVLLGTTTDSGALLQIGTDTTTSAGGMVFGTDTLFFRSGEGLRLQGSTLGTVGFRLLNNSGSACRVQMDTTYTLTLNSESGAVVLKSANVTALTLDTSQGGLAVGKWGFAGAAVSTSTGVNLPAGTTALSSLRMAHGAAPTSPVDGDMWTTTAGLYVRINGATVGPLS